jgi:hypothetical protein
MVKYSGGVAMLKDCTDWRPPRRHDGVIILSPPEAAVPTVPIPAPEVVPAEYGDTPGFDSSLPQVPAAEPGVRLVREYSSGVVTSADFGPWGPPKPEGGLIVEGRWIPLPDVSDESAPPTDQHASPGAPLKRRARKR